MGFLDLKWLLVDTLASFCLAVSSAPEPRIWWSTWGCQLHSVTMAQDSIGCYLLSRKTSVWIDKRYSNGRVTNVVFDPRNASVMYAAGISIGGIYKSTDAGRSWQLWYQERNVIRDFAGESLQIVEWSNEVLLLIGTVNSSELLVLREDATVKLKLPNVGLSSVCSISVGRTIAEPVLVGSRDGVVASVDLVEMKSKVVWKSPPSRYMEIPRILRVDSTGRHMIAILAGFTREASPFGVVETRDGGRNWNVSKQIFASLWAIARIPNSPEVILGGFSEFAVVEGAGQLILYDAERMLATNVSQCVPLRTREPSFWDIKSSTCVLPGKTVLLIAADDGVCFGQAP